jgi:hypothetical protein
MGHHVQPSPSCYEDVSAITSRYAMDQGIDGSIRQFAVGTSWAAVLAV